MTSAVIIPLTEALDPEAEKRLGEIQDNLQKLEQRDWWLWSSAILVMLVLTSAVFSMSFPGLIRIDDPFYQFTLDESVRGLVGLVLIFNTYTIYQQVTVKKLRRQFFKQIEEMRILQARSEQFHRLALVDPLTGLYNRRVAEERLAAEASRSQRHGRPLTVIAIDLNDFKKINDTYGHAAGDRVLKEFAARLSAAIRASDVAARMGGDEFLVLLPECPSGQVDTLLNRLRSMEVVHAGQTIPVRFSAGWVGFERGESVKDFLDRADRTLYADKRRAKAEPKEGPVAAR